MWCKSDDAHAFLGENADHITADMSRTIIHQQDGGFLRKDGQTTTHINRWEEDGSDIIEEDASVDVRLPVEFQDDILAETNTLLFEMLLNNWGILRCIDIREK
jgi:hypothetical protein